MGSSLHPLADSDELDLGAFLYAIRRLPDGIVGASLIVMGQDVEAFAAGGIDIESWAEAEAPARGGGAGTRAPTARSRCCSRARRTSTTCPDARAFQIEWNKIRQRQRAAGWPVESMTPESCAAELGGQADDWARLKDAGVSGSRSGWRWSPATAVAARADARRHHIGYARLTRRWWTPVRDELAPRS